MVTLMILAVISTFVMFATTAVWAIWIFCDSCSNGLWLCKIIVRLKIGRFLESWKGLIGVNFWVLNKVRKKVPFGILPSFRWDSGKLLIDSVFSVLSVSFVDPVNKFLDWIWLIVHVHLLTLVKRIILKKEPAVKQNLKMSKKKTSFMLFFWQCLLINS